MTHLCILDFDVDLREKICNNIIRQYIIDYRGGIMKKLLSQLILLSLLIVLAKQGAPGTIPSYYGNDGSEVAVIELAKNFETIGEAYEVQARLGGAWEILTQ